MYRVTILAITFLTYGIQMTSEQALEKATEIVGSMQALAEKLGVTKGAVGQWKLPGRRIPAEHCPAIERLTDGAVRCELLRPDVDWAAVRTGTTPP
jgi:DNA-binding transcriptional regulator YdaS (Cro superfamily)